MSELDNKKFPYNLTQTQYIENLERQLAEAIKLAYDGYNLGHNHCNEEAYDAWDEKLKQLKEKGDE